MQINLKHSKAATSSLDILLSEEDIHISLIQEPWIKHGKVMGLSNSSYNLFYRKEAGYPRACILIKKGINAFLCSNYSTSDMPVVKIEEAGFQNLTLISAYMPHDKEAPPEELKTAVKQYQQDICLIGCDANARHTIWNSSETNDRGESLLNFILNTKFSICNRGNKPTFIFPSSDRFQGWEEVLDLTLLTESNSVSVEDWMVSNRVSMSDHCFILFNLQGRTYTPSIFRNPRRTNWDEFTRISNRKLGGDKPVEGIHSTADLDMKVDVLERVLNRAFKKSTPISVIRNKSPPWWNGELKKLRNKLRSTFNECYLTGVRQPYQEERKKYKKALRKAKSEAWQSYCTSIENSKESARLSKILSKEHSSPAFIRNEAGEWTNSAQKSLEALVKCHFPGSTSYDMPRIWNVQKPPEDVLDLIVDKEKIAFSINSFEPYKSAGPDGIMPIMLQKLLKHMQTWLVSIFKACLRLTYIPESWRRVKVVFIPKAGKKKQEVAKDFRPISLTSFFLKTLERILDIHIRSLANGDLISKAQHAYMKGKSTETALHEVIGHVEKSLYQKQFTMAAFLDIEGAFNNISVETIIDSLVTIGVNDCVSNWIRCMLQNRIILASNGDASVTQFVSRGTPQGGVLSPLLWVLALNSILLQLNRGGVKAVAYADDVVILSTGLFTSTISEILEGALGKLSKWAASSGLNVNPSKTQLMLFTTKSNIPQFRLPSINGVEIPLTDRATYLGVVLDPKLNWRHNVEKRVEKAYIAYYTCKRLISRNWGLKPKLALWMYTAIVRPVISYGSLVWWPALNKQYNVRQLTSVQRAACAGVTGAMKSCPAEALNVMLNLLPIDLQLRLTATNSAFRIKEGGFWNARRFGHSIILDSQGLTSNLSDYITATLDFRIEFKVKLPTRREWDSNLVVREDTPALYTDGSKMDCGVGAGVYSKDLEISKSFRLGNRNSIFQAEVLGIREACRTIRNYPQQLSEACIFSDSQAALLALKSPITNSKIVRQCKEELNALARMSDITLIWVPGHRNIEGNEKADELARQGASYNESEAVVVGCPRGVRKREIFSFFQKQAVKRWTNTDTCIIAKQTWPSFNKFRTDELLRKPRVDIFRITSTITGHWPLGDHARKLGWPYNDRCRSCNQEESRETVFHFLCECPSLGALRHRMLGEFSIGNLKEIAEKKIDDIGRFIVKSGWFD